MSLVIMFFFAWLIVPTLALITLQVAVKAKGARARRNHSRYTRLTPAERKRQELDRRIAWLEHCEEQWWAIRQSNSEPIWTDEFGWITGRTVCPCGYTTECALWCGDGHTTGQCSHGGLTGALNVGITAADAAVYLQRLGSEGVWLEAGEAVLPIKINGKEATE